MAATPAPRSAARSARPSPPASALGHARPVFFATTLNYVDRAALGVLQPVLAKAMARTAQDYANINFWFRVGYAIGFALQGRFIDMVGVKRAFALAVLLWSIACGAHAFAASAVGFMICRFFLGLSEAANYRPASRPRACGSRRVSAPSPPASSTPAPMSAPC